MGLDIALAADGETAVLDLGSPKRPVRVWRRRRTRRAAERIAARLRRAHPCGAPLLRGVGADRQVSRRRDSALGYLLRTPEGIDRPRDRRLARCLVGRDDDAARRRRRCCRVRRARRGVDRRSTVAAPRALRLASGQLESWRMTSFTGLTADSHSEEGRDVADPLMLPMLRRGAAPDDRLSRLSLRDDRPASPCTTSSRGSTSGVPRTTARRAVGARDVRQVRAARRSSRARRAYRRRGRDARHGLLAPRSRAPASRSPTCRGARRFANGASTCRSGRRRYGASPMRWSPTVRRTRSATPRSSARCATRRCAAT